MQQFLFKGHWYNEWRDEESDAYGIVVADGLSEAVRKLERRLPYLDNLEIKEVEDADEFFFFGETLYHQFKKDEYKVFYTDEEWGSEDGESEG